MEVDHDDYTTRLERRLQRERAARRAAEAIVEGSTRELFLRAERLRLLETIAVACNLGQDTDVALKTALEQVCGFTGWPVGHAYMRKPGRRAAMASTRLWWAKDTEDAADFCTVSESIAFTAGVGLPGRVMAERVPIWIPDVTVVDNFPRADDARRCGLRAAFAFPVMVGREVAAVLEFFSYKVSEPDEAILRTMAQRGAAEAANRAKSAFLAVTSHEVRTPLNAVLGLTEGLARTPLSPKQQGLVDGVRESGGMLLRLLNAVLDLAQIEAGKMSAHMGTFDLAGAMNAVGRVWTPRAKEMGVDLVVDLAGLPDDCALVSDKGKVEQTMVNLLSNALKFSPQGSELVLAVSAQRNRNRYQVRVEIIDQGPGVSPEDRARIFEAFEQTDSGRQVGGTGLGLAICAGNMASLGGTIGQDETPDGRCRFWFEFPAEAGAAVQDVDPVDVLEASMDRPLRVLAAEDNAANRQVLQVLLEPLGVELTLVEDGLAAVEAVQVNAFDLILMDANMPRMDGAEAVRAIRALGGLPREMPIFMLTANVFAEDVSRYRAAGVDGVLKKPIEVGELFAALAGAAARVEPLESLQLTG